MYECLIKALRHCVLQNPCDGCPFYSGMDEQTEQCASMNLLAADAIEELTGFVQEAERDRDEYRERLDKANDAIEELQGRAKVLEKVADKWYEAAPKWIPVTERLPECDLGEEVGNIEWISCGMVNAGCFGRGGKYRDAYFRTWTDAGEGINAKDADYWRGVTIPQPPKEEPT